MKILVVNRGSSSLGYQLIDVESRSVVTKGLCERIGAEGSKLTHQPSGKDKFVIEGPVLTHRTVIEMVMEALQDVDHGVIRSTGKIPAIGHRVLHSGTVYSDSTVMNEGVKRVIHGCSGLGLLHNPANLMGIEACEAAMPGTPNVAVFDTAFDMSMSEKAYMYAIPRECFEKYGIRRCGFHGTSHKFISAEAIKLGGLDPRTAEVIMCHLGNSSDVPASIGGKCVDTSMGLTPPEGLIMGTRNDDVDPAVFQFIMNKEGLDINEMLNILNKESNVYGMTNGISSNFRDIENARAEGNHLAEVTLDAFIYRVTKYVGAYAATMNGVDAIASTVGVGENDGAGGKAIYENLAYMGVKIDDELNDIRGEEGMTSSADSEIKVILIPANEKLTIVRETPDLVQ